MLKTLTLPLILSTIILLLLLFRITQKRIFGKILGYFALSLVGLDLGESNRILTEKVEELTLYLIQQQKLMDQMRSELDALKK